jgi:predicted ester cyclase
LSNNWETRLAIRKIENHLTLIFLLWKAFPDIITFDDIIIEGNKVKIKGEFMDLQRTNKQFRVNGMTVFSSRDAKCIERWNLVDMMSLMEQLRSQS